VSEERGSAWERARPVRVRLCGFRLARDGLLKRQDNMVEQRSRELLKLVVALGPTFIKIGQDILPAAYAAGLADLQDNVPPFSAAQGRAVIERELGIQLSETFSEFSLEPIAAASIGQVYCGTLRATGEELAIKVQRPNVLYEVALDLYMVRALAPAWQHAQEINTDLVGLIDAYAVTFVNELDYTREAAATTAFSAAMTECGLGSVMTSGRGLCGVALNAYLTMLLDTGTLHCDPHPGNLMRTTDGKLCILDFGMCLEVSADLQLSLLEFIANLQAENYEEVPNDLVKLSFVPAEKIDELRASGLTVALAQTIRIAAKGGGPKGAMKRLVAENKEKYAPQLLAKYGTTDSPEATKKRQRLFREDWQREMAEDAMARGGDGGAAAAAGPATSTTADITGKIEEMQKQNSNVFAIPDYFVYMSRAFATLEGIGLSSDPDYAILQECFPYLAKRLLSDDSPRARGALRTLLYGTGDELNLDQLQKVTQGLESYTTSTASVASSTGKSDAGRTAALNQIAAVLLAEDGNYVQSLVLCEAAVALDAAARSRLASTARAAVRAAAASAAARAGGARAAAHRRARRAEAAEPADPLQPLQPHRLQWRRATHGAGRRRAGRGGGGRRRAAAAAARGSASCAPWWAKPPRVAPRWRARGCALAARSQRCRRSGSASRRATRGPPSWPRSWRRRVRVGSSASPARSARPKRTSPRGGRRSSPDCRLTASETNSQLL